MEFIFRVCYVAPLQGAVSGGDFPVVAPWAQPQAGIWCPFRALVCFAPSALKAKEATGKRKHTGGLPAPSSLLSKNLRKSAESADKKCLLSIGDCSTAHGKLAGVRIAKMPRVVMLDDGLLTIQRANTP